MRKNEWKIISEKKERNRTNVKKILENAEHEIRKNKREKKTREKVRR